MKRVIVILVVLAVMIGGTLGIYSISAEQKPAGLPPDAEIITVERGAISAQVNATGNVAAEARVSLGFKTSGRVAEVLVDESDFVTKGQVLARLETDDVDLQIAQAEAGLVINEVRLEQSLEGANDYDIASARAGLQSAQENYERVLEGPDEAEIAAAEAALASAQESYRRVLEGPDEAEIAAAEAALASAQENYQRVLAGPDATEIAAARAAVASAQAHLDKLRAGRTTDEITVARANLEQAKIALQQAQTEYDKIAWTSQIGMTPQAAQLEQATVAYESALANYNIALEGYSDREILAAEAQVVQAESTLANLLAMPRPADIAAAGAQVKQAQSTLEKLQEMPHLAEVAAAQAQVAQAQSALEKLQEMPRRADVAAAQAQVAQAQATLDRLLEPTKDTEIAIAEAQIEQTKVGLEQARLAKENTTLKAPRAGKVATLNLREGEFVSMGAPVVQIVSLTQLHIDVLIDEIDINKVQMGQEAEITLDAIPDETLIGYVTGIAPTAITEGGVVSYKVTVQLEPTDLAVLEGMTANVGITTERKENALLLTHRAVQVDRETGRLFVERVKGLGTELVEVETGLRDENNVEILRGLSEGSKVVIRPLTQAERIRATFGE